MAVDHIKRLAKLRARKTRWTPVNLSDFNADLWRRISNAKPFGVIEVDEAERRALVIR